MMGFHAPRVVSLIERGISRSGTRPIRGNKPLTAECRISNTQRVPECRMTKDATRCTRKTQLVPRLAPCPLGSPLVQKR